MVLVRFILNHLAKKSYQVFVFAFHEVVLFAFLPVDAATRYGLITLGIYAVYFGLMSVLLALRYYDIKPKNHNSLFFVLERVLILK